MGQLFCDSPRSCLRGLNALLYILFGSSSLFENMMSIDLILHGASGRMGRAITALVDGNPDTEFNIRARLAHEDEGGLYETDPVSVFADNTGVGLIIIDFSLPDACTSLLPYCLKAGAGLVTGTTGLSDIQQAEIQKASEKVPIVQAGNMSLGVNLLTALVEQTAARLHKLTGDSFDIEITERHHRHKVDAPSGTALMLGEAAARGKGSTLHDVQAAPHQSANKERKSGEIGFAVVRAGGIIGEHDVQFASETEILSLSHQAIDRSVFAEGALVAAKWLSQNGTGLKPPGLYTMRDVLGLE